MDRVGTIDLRRASDRLELATRIFEYPADPHRRRHGPDGYITWESYRDWLRDEFSYRCVFSLVRETWPGTVFHIDHLIPRKERPDLAYRYDNLLLISSQLNLKKGKKPLPDPAKVALGRCLYVFAKGKRIGEIEAREAPGAQIIEVLRLDSEDATRDRRNWLRILRVAAVNDEALFRELIGYPKGLPNLGRKVIDKNAQRSGINQSAFYLREVEKQLPEWY